MPIEQHRPPEQPPNSRRKFPLGKFAPGIGIVAFSGRGSIDMATPKVFLRIRTDRHANSRRPEGVLFGVRRCPTASNGDLRFKAAFEDPPSPKRLWRAGPPSPKRLWRAGRPAISPTVAEAMVGRPLRGGGDQRSDGPHSRRKIAHTGARYRTKAIGNLLWLRAEAEHRRSATVWRSD